MSTNGLRVPVLAIFLAALGCIAGAAPAGTGCAGTGCYEDVTLGVAVSLPEGWQVHRLDTDGSSGWQVGFASPESLRDAKQNGQPSDNARYQDVLLERLPPALLPDVARQYCHDAASPTVTSERIIDEAPAIACSAVRAVGGDVQLLVETHEVFIRVPRGVLHLSAEARGGTFGAARRDAFERVLRGMRLIAKDAPSEAPSTAK